MIDDSLTPLERIKEHVKKAEEYIQLVEEEKKKLNKEEQKELIRWFHAKRNEDLK